MKSAALILLLSFLVQSGNSQNLIPYRYNFKFGFADESGKIVIEANFDKVDWFDENGYSRVEVEGFWGIIDKNGRFVVTPEYTGIFNFSEGLAAFCTEGEYSWLQGEIIGGKWGFINEKNEIIISPKYHRTENFYNGYAIVQIEGDNWGNWGVIDKTGKQILPYKYATYSFDMRPFPGIRWDEKEKGKLWYRKGQRDETWIQIDLKGIPTGKKMASVHGESEESTFPYTVEKNGKYALKSNDGKLLTDYLYDYGIYFYEGDESAVIIKDRKYGLINKNGLIMIQPEFDQIQIEDNYLVLQKNDKYAISNHSAKPLDGGNDLKWYDGTIHYLGENIYSLKTNTGFELFLTNGNKLSEKSVYENTGNRFNDGLLKICKNKKWGFIDKDGNSVIECKYPYVYDFNNGYSKVDLNQNQYKIPDEGYINKNGVEFFKGTLGLKLTENKQGKKVITDQYENEIVPDISEAFALTDEYISYKKDGVLYVTNKNAEKVLSGNFTSILSSRMIHDPDLNLNDNYTFAAFRNDSIFIYDENFSSTLQIPGPWNFADKELFTKKQLIIDRRNGAVLKNVNGENSSKRFLNLYYYPEMNLFLAEGKNDSMAVLNSNGSFISDYKKQNIVLIDKAYISFTGSSKSQKAELYNLQGKKINQIPSNNIHQGYQVAGLYFIENDKTKKRGYYWNGILKEAEYDDILTCLFGNSQYVLTVKNNKITIFDKDGNQINKVEFESFKSGENIAVVKQNAKYGIITIKENQLVFLLSASYDDIPEINSFGALTAVKKDGKYVYINPEESVIIDKNFSYAFQFSHNNAFAFVNGKEGVIDTYGNWVIAPEYKNFDYFIDQNDTKVYKANTIDNKTILFDETGKNILPAEIDSVDFNIIENYSFIAAYKNKKMGIINFKGEIIIPAQYKSIQTFYFDSDDRSFEYFNVQKENGYGLIDLTGKEITPAQYDLPYNYDDEGSMYMMHLIPVRKKGKYGALNFEGKEVLPCEFDRIEWYSEESEFGLARIKQDGKWGLIGLEGKIIFKPQFDELYIYWEISDQFADLSQTYYYKFKNNGKTGLANSTGEIIFPNNYSDIQLSYDCMDGNGIELINGKNKGIGNIKGKIYLQPIYKSVECYFNNDELFFMVKNGKLYEILNENGLSLNKYNYEMMDWIGGDYIASGMRNNVWYYITTDGTEIKMDE